MTLSAALRTRDTSLLPSRRDEGWRWTDLRGLLRVLPEPSPEGQAIAPGGPFAGCGGDELAVVNGRCLNFPGLIAVGEGDHPVARLRFVSTPGATSHESRIAVTVAAGASLTLLESYEGPESADYIAGAELAITLGEGARLTRIALMQDSADAVSVSSAQVTLAPGAVFEQTVLLSGARRQRHETQVGHPGGGATVRMDGAYVLDGRGHADLTTGVAHQGPGGSTDQLIKGVVADQARGVFQGRIGVLAGADGTDARMGHHALILSERAEVDALPQLEIFADDVSCSHGNTVGSLDEEALFYARSRGIPDDAARAMLTLAFVGEVVDRIPHEGAREAARGWLLRRLEVAS